jgi:hypothetical protein
VLFDCRIGTESDAEFTSLIGFWVDRQLVSLPNFAVTLARTSCRSEVAL